MAYILTFCRLVTGFVFVASFWGKVQNMNQFVQTITSFKLLHSHYSRPLALLFLLGEAAVVVFLVIGGQLLSLAFGLTLILLAAFTAALASVLARNIQTACSCFGSSDNPVTYADVGRNVGLGLVAAVGLWATKIVSDANVNLTFVELLFMAIIATVFILVWTNLSDLVTLFRIS